MAILSSATLIQAVSLFQLTLAYYLVKSPSTLTQQNLVIILGAAMDIPPPTGSLSIPSSATALAGTFLALLALSDLTASTMAEEAGSLFWITQAPLRLVFFFGITGWVYLGKFGLEDELKGSRRVMGNSKVSAREVLCNSFVFTWGFLQMLSWFWVSAIFLCMLEVVLKDG